MLRKKGQATVFPSNRGDTLAELGLHCGPCILAIPIAAAVLNAVVTPREGPGWGWVGPEQSGEQWSLTTPHRAQTLQRPGAWPSLLRSLPRRTCRRAGEWGLPHSSQLAGVPRLNWRATLSKSRVQGGPHWGAACPFLWSRISVWLLHMKRL